MLALAGVVEPMDVEGAGEGREPASLKCSPGREEKILESRKSSRSAEDCDSNLIEDDDDVCRICRTPGDEGSPLYYPCACSGSIKYVHQECLLQWLNHSNARQCEVCKHAFSFSPVYADNAPARLPIEELLLGIALKSARGIRFFLRLMSVLSIWLLFIPFTTFWIWRFTFVRSFSEAQKLFIGRFTPGLLLTDCVHGFLLSAGIVFIFLGATSLREYFRHLRDIGGPQEDIPEEREDRVRGARQVFQEVEGPVGLAADLQWRFVPPVGVNADVGAGHGLAAGAGHLIRRNAENVAARLELQAARLEAHVEQMFEAVEDPDGAEDVPFDELVGMQGPVFHLIENAITVLASNAIFLALVALIPFTLGRVALSIVSGLVLVAVSASGVPLSNAMSSNIGTVSQPGNMSSIQSRGDIYLGDAWHTAADSTISVINVTVNGMSLGTALPDDTMAPLRFSDAATVAVGYSVMLLVLSLYVGFIALIRYSRGDSITVSHSHGVATMVEAAPSIARQVISGVTYMATMVKVVFLLIIELGVFPFMCGWWLDICTLAMLDVSMAHRVEFFQASPLTSSLLHWLVGIIYMLQISILVSLLREVLRPGVLHFLRDPTDPNYNPFRDLIDDPMHKHVRRVILSVIVYGSLIVMVVFVPVQLAILVAPSMFPLDFRMSDPFTEIPADMLLFHICIPFAVEHFRPRATIKAALFQWFSSVGWALGLRTFLLLGPDEADANNNILERRPGGQGLAADPYQHAIHVEQRESAVFLENSTEDAAEYYEDEESTKEYKFVLRIVMLLVGAWITLLAFNSAMVLVPVSLGRGIFGFFSQFPIARGAKCNDLYAFNLGCYILWATVAAVRCVVVYFRAHDVSVLLMHVSKWSAIMAKSFVLLSLWIIAIPIVVGLLFELLLVVPLRVPIDETPVFIFYQDWALGLVFLKIWTRLVILGHVTPLADESWRVRFEQVRVDGFANLQGFWVLKEIIGPILFRLLTALCVPYIFGSFIFPHLGFSLIVNSAVNRFAWLGCLALVALWYGMNRLRQWLLNLHNSIRDDRYLVGRRLHNFGERKRKGLPRDETVESSPIECSLGAVESSPIEPNFDAVVESSRMEHSLSATATHSVSSSGGVQDKDDFVSLLDNVTASGTSSDNLLEVTCNITEMESEGVLLEALIHKEERLGVNGASLRFRHSTVTCAGCTEEHDMTIPNLHHRQ